MILRFLVPFFLFSTLLFSDPYIKQVTSLASYLKEQWYITSERLLIVDPSVQKLFVFHEDGLNTIYSISTSKLGLGSLAGSYKTPVGMHRIVEKYGEGVALGTIFKSRINTKKKIGLQTGRSG